MNDIFKITIRRSACDEAFGDRCLAGSVTHSRVSTFRSLQLLKRVSNATLKDYDGKLPRDTNKDFIGRADDTTRPNPVLLLDPSLSKQESLDFL